MTGPEWYFKRRDPGEAIVGGVDNFAFQMSIDTLVRETIQNANDQRVGDKVKVEFVFEEHEGESAKRLLELIGWDSGLKSHLEAISTSESHLKARATKALKAAQNLKLNSLTIRDFGARGLEGPEDGDSGNFVMLCRHVLVTDAGQKRLKGGAFGIGKSVLWAFSGASVALFSSLPMESSSKGKVQPGEPRVFGRAYLVSHKFGDSKTWHNGDGHFGLPETTEGKRWAVSLRSGDAQNAVAGTSLDRDWKTVGTSILIPFLDNPRVDEVLSGKEVATQVRNAVQKWFWPSLMSGILEVRVGTRSTKGEMLENIAVPTWAEYFQRALGATSSELIDDEVGSATVEIPVAVPARSVQEIHDAVKTKADLYLTRLSDDEISMVPEQVRNSIALIRGARMVVEYHTKSLPSLVPPFVGVIVAGDFRGKEKSDKHLEAFFRDSEPPAHDRWDKASEKIGQNYDRGGHAAIARFYEDLGGNMRKLLGGNSSGSGKIPRKLAALLKGGSGRGKKPRTEKFGIGKKEVVREANGKIEATFSVRRNFGKGPWTSVVSLVLIDEQGTERELNHRSIDTKSLKNLGIAVKAVPGSLSSNVRQYEILVPDGVEEFETVVRADAGTSRVAGRSLADLKVTFSRGMRS